jgi:hypothetical protein
LGRRTTSYFNSRVDRERSRDRDLLLLLYLGANFHAAFGTIHYALILEDSNIHGTYRRLGLWEHWDETWSPGHELEIKTLAII